MVERFGIDSAQAKARSAASEELDSLIDTDPPAALAVIISLLSRTRRQFTTAVIAAGPLEELICRQGDRIIAEVERVAAIDRQFRIALSGVSGRDRMAPALRRRVDEACAEAERP